MIGTDLSVFVTIVCLWFQSRQKGDLSSEIASARL